jgi:hypothetical protein
MHKFLAIQNDRLYVGKRLMGRCSFTLGNIYIFSSQNLALRSRALEIILIKSQLQLFQIVIYLLGLFFFTKHSFGYFWYDKINTQNKHKKYMVIKI